MINVEFLRTLDDRNFRNGLVEVIKMGLIRDKELLTLLKTNTLQTLKDNVETLETIMRKSISNKVYVVENDLFEKGLRQTLNLGHTIGHAIEAHENGTLLHGEAVAIGTVLEVGLISESLKADVESIYDIYGIQYKLPPHIEVENLV